MGHPSRAARAVLITGNVRVLHRDKAGALNGAVRLEQADLADAPSRVLASSAISLAPGVEQARFQLTVDEADPKGRYLITAVLEGADRQTGQPRRFGATTAYPWHPDVAGEVSIEVRPWN